jgi:hypothetical protein
MDLGETDSRNLETCERENMGNLGKYLILFGAVGLAGLCSVADEANASVSSDELYSETIYITKSAAEVPTSFESNARSNDGDMELASANDSNAPVAEVEKPVAPRAKAKKVAKRGKR